MGGAGGGSMLLLESEEDKNGIPEVDSEEVCGISYSSTENCEIAPYLTTVLEAPRHYQQEQNSKPMGGFRYLTVLLFSQHQRSV